MLVVGVECLLRKQKIKEEILAVNEKKALKIYQISIYKPNFMC